MRPIKLTISAFGPYAKETEIILDELGELEKAGETDVDKMSGIFGHIMEEIFAYRPQFLMQSHLHFMGKRVEMKESRGCFGVNMRIRRRRPLWNWSSSIKGRTIISGEIRSTCVQRTGARA